MNLEKLPIAYRKLKIKKTEYSKGIPRYDFNKIPKELQVKADSTGLVLYADEEIKVGKIKRIIFDKHQKFPYVEVLAEKEPIYRPLSLLFSQVILLDPKTRLYKLKLKKFDKICAHS